MNAEFTALIQKMVSEQGRDALLDKARCKALLADYCKSDYQKERRLLTMAVEAGVPEALANAGADLDTVKNDCVKKLQDEYFLAETVCHDVTDMLAEILTPAKPAEAEPVSTVTAETRPCPNCGKPVQAGWKLCPYCGAALGEREEKTSENAEERTVQTEAEKTKTAVSMPQRHTKRNVIIAIACVAVVVAVVLGLTTISAPPEAPVNITASNVTDNSVTLSWNPSNRDAAYNIYANTSSSPLKTNITESPIIIDNLHSGTNYSFSVTGTRNNEESEKSQAVSVKTLMGVLNGYISPNIMTKFGIAGDTTQDVTDAFNKLHEYLQSCTPEELESDEYIKLGDYIDLASLTVPNSYVWSKDSGKYVNTIHTVNNTDFGTGAGTSLRLIVVGINSFAQTIPHTPTHIAMQFKNVPFGCYINRTDTNEWVYEYGKSNIRQFLINDFLPGLEQSGVPADVLWAPKQTVEYTVINDKLWLPTKWQLFGKEYDSNYESEKDNTHVWFEYYTYDSTRVKKSSFDTNTWYWEASGSTTISDGVNHNGHTDAYRASAVGGCAPAFCVY
jgi:hypothetical protein